MLNNKSVSSSVKRYKQEQRAPFSSISVNIQSWKKHREIISPAFWERKEILQYKHTNGLCRDLKEDWGGIRAGCIRGEKKPSKKRDRIFREISSKSIK